MIQTITDVFQRIQTYLLTLILQNRNLSFLKSVDPDQLASDKAISSGSTIFLYVCEYMLYNWNAAGYGKCSKISNSFLFLFSIKMLVFRAEINKMLVRIANREDANQTASSEAV